MQEIKAHTGLRGIAAFLVVFYHLSFLPNHLTIEDITPAIKRSYLMVDLFFILSGFIISYVYMPRAGIALSSREFWLKRVIRLYPLHAFCLTYLVLGRVLLDMISGAHGGSGGALWTHESITQLLMQVALVHSFSTVPIGWNIPTWSISAEMFAYALFPGLAVAIQRFPGTSSSMLLVSAIAFYAWIASSGGSLDLTSWPSPLRCLAGFFLGVLVFRWQQVLRPRSDRLINAAQIALSVAAVSVLAFPVNDAAAIPVFAGLAVITSSDRGWLSTILARPTAQYFGQISYSVYLNHVCLISLGYPVWTALAKRIGLSPSIDRGALLLTTVLFVIVVSHWTHRYVEVPARRYLTKRFL